MGKLKENKLINKLLSLKLPEEDYAIFGSGPLFAHGLIDSINDIDIIAKGKAWEIAKERGKVKRPKFGNVKMVSLFDQKIEVFEKLYPGNWDILRLIEDADTMEGIRFVNLKDTLRWKKKLGRKKDKKHIKIIEKYLKT